VVAWGRAGNIVMSEAPWSFTMLMPRSGCTFEAALEKNHYVLPYFVLSLLSLSTRLSIKLDMPFLASRCVSHISMPGTFHPHHLLDAISPLSMFFSMLFSTQYLDPLVSTRVPLPVSVHPSLFAQLPLTVRYLQIMTYMFRH
jgi:hypothetical protein